MPVRLQIDKLFRESWDCKLVSWFIIHRHVLMFAGFGIAGLIIGHYIAYGP